MIFFHFSFSVQVKARLVLHLEATALPTWVALPVAIVRLIWIQTAPPQMFALLQGHLLQLLEVAVVEEVVPQEQEIEDICFKC